MSHPLNLAWIAYGAWEAYCVQCAVLWIGAMRRAGQ